MYTSFSVERFRGLTKCALSDLRPITLITGTNNTGKTALLEAMLIHAGRSNPQLALVANSLRGIARINVDPSHHSDPPWLSLFSNFDDSKTVKFVGEAFNKFKHSEVVTVALSTVREGVELAGLGANLQQFNQWDTSVGLTKVLKLELSSGRRPKASRHFLIIDSKQQRVVPPPVVPDAPARFISAHNREGSEFIAQQFSEFEIKDHIKLLVEALQPMEPRLKDLRILFNGETALYGDIGLPNRKFIPLSLMGDGLNRVASLVLNIGSCPNGVVLIDDIDTGLHYSVMESFWRSIFAAGRLFNTQVIATTHSGECVKAALDANNAEDDRTRLGLVRLERGINEVKAFNYSPEELDLAFKADLEVR